MWSHQARGNENLNDQRKCNLLWSNANLLSLSILSTERYGYWLLGASGQLWEALMLQGKQSPNCAPPLSLNIIQFYKSADIWWDSVTPRLSIPDADADVIQENAETGSWFGRRRHSVSIVHVIVYLKSQGCFCRNGQANLWTLHYSSIIKSVSNLSGLDASPSPEPSLGWS